MTIQQCLSLCFFFFSPLFSYQSCNLAQFAAAPQRSTSSRIQASQFNIPERQSYAHRYAQKPQKRYEPKAPRFVLNHKDKRVCASILTDWKRDLKAAKAAGSTSQIKRLEQRIDALHQSKNNSLENSKIEQVLYQELQDSVYIAEDLLLEHTTNIHAHMAYPAVMQCAHAAVLESDIAIAFSLSDTARAIVTVLKQHLTTTAKATCAISRGVVRGVKEVATVEHFKNVVTGIAELTKAVFIACSDSNELEDAFDVFTQEVDHPFARIAQQNIHARALIKVHLEQRWRVLKAMSWEQLLESGAEIGTVLILDLVVINAAGASVSAVKRAWICDLATICEGSTEAYAVQVASVGKLVVQEGEVATLAALAELEKAPQMVAASELLLGEALLEEVEILKKIQVCAAEDILIKESIFIEEGLSVLRHKAGDYRIALEDFDRLNLSNIKPLPGKDGKIGFMYDGKTVVVRLGSDDGRPTLEFQKFTHTWKKTKIRYGEKNG